MLSILMMILAQTISATGAEQPPAPPEHLPLPPEFSTATKRALEASFRQVIASHTLPSLQAASADMAVPPPPVDLPVTPLFAEETQRMLDASFARVAFQNPRRLASLAEAPVYPASGVSGPANTEAQGLQVAQFRLSTLPPQEFLKIDETPLDQNSAVAMALQELKDSKEEPTIFQQVHRSYSNLEHRLQRLERVGTLEKTRY